MTRPHTPSPPTGTELFRRYLRQQRERYGDRLWLPESTESPKGEHAQEGVSAGYRFAPPLSDTRVETPEVSAPVPTESPKGEQVQEGVSAGYRFTPPYASLEDLEADIRSCQLCPLGATRTKFVFGVGNPHAKMVLVGEAPGQNEDRVGEPFVGRAGQLLDKILAAINLTRQDVYICNILKCRPPANRNPEPSEMDCCEPHLQEQIRLINPKIILALGKVAAGSLLQTSDSIKNMRGRVLDYHGRKLLVTYHPAALLRNPQYKRPTWEDVQLAKTLYDAETDDV